MFALYRSGTRVVEVLGSLPGLKHVLWTSSNLEGLIDVPFLNVTPSTRSGIIHDERFAAACEVLRPLEEDLNGLIAKQQRAKEKQASHQLMRAFHEALLALPPESTTGSTVINMLLVKEAKLRTPSWTKESCVRSCAPGGSGHGGAEDVNRIAIRPLEFLQGNPSFRRRLQQKRLLPAHTRSCGSWPSPSRESSNASTKRDFVRRA